MVALTDAFKRAQRLSEKKLDSVEFDFCGIRCIVNKETNLKGFNKDYNSAFILKWDTIGPDAHVYTEEEKKIIEEHKRPKETITLKEFHEQSLAFAKQYVPTFDGSLNTTIGIWSHAYNQKMTNPVFHISIFTKKYGIIQVDKSHPEDCYKEVLKKIEAMDKAYKRVEKAGAVKLTTKQQTSEPVPEPVTEFESKPKTDDTQIN